MLFLEQAADMEAKHNGLDEAIADAYERCRNVTSEHSKTFHSGSLLLDSDEQRGIWAVYTWCRSTDELVDGPSASYMTINDLDRWEMRMHKVFDVAKGSLDACTNWEELALAHTIRRFSLIRRPFEDMIAGMAMDLVKTRYATFEELEVYCYRVAGTVGLMSLPILGLDARHNGSKELHGQTIAAALSLGVALQLTNILRDIGEDARRNRIYVPHEDLHRFNITEEELLEASHRQDLFHQDARWRDFMEYEIARCEHFYMQAERGIVGLAEKSRLGVMAARYIYGEILEAVRRNGYDTFNRRAYVPLHEKVILLAKAWWYVQELSSGAGQFVRQM